MTEEQKLEKCISLIWDFGEIYGEDDIEQFQSTELRTYPQFDELEKYLEDLKAKAKVTKELQEENKTAKEIIKTLCKYPTFNEEGNLVVLEVTKTNLDKAEKFLKECEE